MPSEAEMQEKLKNMSPEELKQFQIQNCIFCHIINGKVASKKIYEDEKCLAILDINPANPGHILLLPKEHYAIMPLIPEDVIEHLFMVSKQLSAALLRALKAHGTNIFVANGAVAGQKAQHFMMDIIPRMEKDGIGLELNGKKISEKDLEEVRKVLVEKVSKDLGIKLQEEPKKKVEDIKKAEAPKEKIVDAEFKEAAKSNPKKAPKKKPEKKEKRHEEDVSLDDISDLLTGKR